MIKTLNTWNESVFDQHQVAWIAVKFVGEKNGRKLFSKYITPHQPLIHMHM